MNFLIELFFLGFFWVSSLFSNCGRNILQHWRKNFREVVKSAFYLNNKTFRGKFVFWRKYSLSQVFRVLMKNSANFCRKAFCPIWKTSLQSFRGSSGITLSFSSREFTPTNGFWGKRFGIFQNFFDMVVKTVFFVSLEHFQGNIFLFHKLFKIFSCFQTLRKTFRFFLAKIILLGCQNCFQVSSGYFWKSLFLEANSLNSFFIFGLRSQIFGLSAKFLR